MGNAKPASSTTRANRDQLECVQGQINFARRAPDEKAQATTPTPGYDFPKVIYDVTIHNARPIVNELSLDQEGFTLIQHKMPCVNESDPDILRKKYLEEMVPFIKDYFDASWVQTVDLGGLTIRSIGGSSFSRPANQTKFSVRGHGAGHAHIDYAPVAGPMIAARDSQLQGIEIRPYSRLMIIQTWQALSPPPQDFPLTFCDASSIEDADLLNTYYRSPHGVTHKSWVLHYNPSHRWYYLPEMTSDEFFLFKGYDSAMHYHRWSAHSTFDNRRAYLSAKPRESIESRFYVYYE
ncbi:CmcJ/NvfI family oxidoreductase [Bradyrhizobium pachyrhizi]|uniref:CmcJ/NvfI family oxidoreductase n=1 Tax=Bradyrhizobium pachyrhizi TaxID=280333 RepID=UPI0009E895A2|nr:CmcJ/NvfI family oxidoreductase [Bradyrhizobium pachyrhizi]